MADNKSSEGKLIGGKRYCGKTTRLIKRASEEQLYILCVNRHMAKMIFQQAQGMGLQIPFPITIEDLPLKGYMKEVLVDEVEMVLSQLVSKRVVEMSSSMKFEELDSLRQSKQPLENIDWASEGDRTVINVHVTDAIKGLKAVQREAKKATAALKELEEQKKESNRDILIKTLADLHGVPIKHLKNTKITYTPLSKAEGYKPQTVVFDEMLITKCPKCESKNVQITEKATGCNDCGWHDYA